MAVVTVEEERQTPVTRIEIPLRTLAFMALLTVAAIIRFGHLGILALDVEEARQALATSIGQLEAVLGRTIAELNGTLLASDLPD